MLQIKRRGAAIRVNRGPSWYVSNRLTVAVKDGVFNKNVVYFADSL